VTLQILREAGDGEAASEGQLGVLRKLPDQVLGQILRNAISVSSRKISVCTGARRVRSFPRQMRKLSLEHAAQSLQLVAQWPRPRPVRGSGRWNAANVALISLEASG